MAARSSLAGFNGRPNLRHYHRIPVHLAASLEQDGDLLPECTINNLSRSGLHIECASAILERLVPNGKPVAPHMAIPVHLTFSVPGEAGSICIRARCDVVTVRRVSRDSFNVGMSFAEFEDDSDTHLDHYINKQLAASI
ncbi:PilZ domain-containing protein [Salicola sp. Rm-C-2C1-2]|uniref:PilZ domain-containing protein n=1 Tax=Salicola sp. Rm-C-2C1-2 TaxID=3141321 RepID=UPI0032E44B80